MKYTTRVAGFSLLSFVSTSYTGFFFVTLDDWKERTSRRDAVSGDRAARESGTREASRRIRVELSSPRDSGRRDFRRIHLRPRRPRRQGRASSSPTICKSSWPRRRSGRKSRRHGQHVPAERSAAVSRSRPREGVEAGRAAERRVSNHPSLHGRTVRELLQSLRPPMAGLRRGRGRVSQEPGQRRASSTCAMPRATWSRCPR